MQAVDFDFILARHFLLRGFFSSVDDLSPGVASIEGIRLHPLRGDAPAMRFAHASDTPSNALYPRDFSPSRH
ncbi:hypothetical protein [Streptomyces sp. NPDC059651]|uniref:hypothetical protein n=1 Tax=unclassified Streptomyces TaxID=2593676 RepID=UPI000B272038